MGVDIFFVISGYLITSILLFEMDNAKFSFSSFYYRRLKRLAPPLIVVLLLVVAYGYFVLLPDDFIELAKQVLASQFYFSNMYFWQNLNYFGLTADSTILLHTWSLSLEEQFYLFYPIALFSICKFFRSQLWLILLVGLLSSFFLNLYFVNAKPELAFYLLPTRAWELLAGGMIVFIQRYFVDWSKLAVNLTGLFGLSFIVFGVLAYKDTTVFPGYHALWPVLGTVLIILSFNDQRSFLKSTLSSKLFVYFGKLSYSLYLVHWPINVFAGDLLGTDYDIYFRLAMFGTTILAAAALYHLVEQPVRNSRVMDKQSTVLKSYSIVLASTLILFVVSEVTSGIPERFSRKSQYYAAFVNDDPPAQYMECNLGATNSTKELISSDFCLIGDSSVEPSWVIVGDSHALALSPAVDIFLTEIGGSGLFLFRHACPPLLNIDILKSRGECKDFNTKVFDFIQSQKSITSVLLVSTWIYPNEGIFTTQHDTKLPITESRELFKSSFGKTVRTLASIQKKVFIWEPIPIALMNVPKALAKGIRVQNVETRYSTYSDRFAFYFDAQLEVQKHINLVFSPSRALCDATSCKVIVDDIPIYKDNAHISYSSKYFWAQYLIEAYSEAY